MKSALYEGVVRHERRGPVRHRFEQRLFMTYLDLAELDRVFRGRWLWSTRRPAIARFRREDHLGDPDVPLDRAVRDAVAARTGRRPAGPIRLLTHLRTFGFAFNPISLSYCFDEGGEEIEAILAEVSNTPWNERHLYALSKPRESEASELRFATAKAFHVSPFMGMDQTYRWAFGIPGERLSVGIQSLEDGPRPLFHADLELERREITGPALASVLLRYPLMTVRVVAGIYWQAVLLRRKGVPEHPHPAERESARPAPYSVTP